MTCIYQRQQIYTSVNHVIIIYAILCLPIGSPSGWRRKASKERLIFFMLKDENKKIPKNEFSLNAIPRDEQKCIPACHTFYMSYDKNVKRMASMHICLHTSLHGYFFIKLQLHFHTTMNQYVNKSIRQRIIEASKKRPFSTKGISPSI